MIATRHAAVQQRPVVTVLPCMAAERPRGASISYGNCSATLPNGCKRVWRPAYGITPDRTWASDMSFHGRRSVCNWKKRTSSPERIADWFKLL